MRKIILFLLGSALLVSCGRDKKKDSDSENQVVIKDSYSIEIQAIYEKDDSLSVVCKKSGYWDYEHPIAAKVKGQPALQKVIVLIPEGIKAENVQITLSTNKEQKTSTVKGISIINNGKTVFNGNNMAYVSYFDANSGLVWDYKNLRNNLNFDGKYAPGIAGNANLESVLTK